MSDMTRQRTKLATAGLLTAAMLMAGCPPYRFALADEFTAAQRTEIVQILRQALTQDPSILKDAVKSMQADAARKKGEAVVAAITANRSALFDANDPVAGNTHGDVTIVEFFDPRCPYCRRLEPQMTQLLQQDHGIRLIYKDLPILGPPSELGSRALLAAERQGAYEKLREAMMQDAPDITLDSIHRLAERLGLDWNLLQHDMDDPAVAQKLRDNMRLASAMGIDGTPAIVVGEKMVAGEDMWHIQAAVALARQDRAPTQ